MIDLPHSPQRHFRREKSIPKTTITYDADKRNEENTPRK
jgi:hypothetical protein